MPFACFRISDVKAEDGVNAGDSAKGDILSATKRSTEDLETLMSQMHDLSFMLASDLSIPPKQRWIHSNFSGLLAKLLFLDSQSIILVVQYVF